MELGKQISDVSFPVVTTTKPIATKRGRKLDWVESTEIFHGNDGNLKANNAIEKSCMFSGAMGLQYTVLESVPPPLPNPNSSSPSKTNGV